MKPDASNSPSAPSPLHVAARASVTVSVSGTSRHAVTHPLQGPGSVFSQLKRQERRSHHPGIHEPFTPSRETEPADGAGIAGGASNRRRSLPPNITLDTESLRLLGQTCSQMGHQGFVLGGLLLDAQQDGGWESEYTPTFSRFLEHQGMNARMARQWMRSTRVLVRILQPDRKSYESLCLRGQPGLGLMAALLEDFPQVLLAGSDVCLPEHGRLWHDEKERQDCREKAFDVIGTDNLPEPELREALQDMRVRWMDQGLLLSPSAQARLTHSQLVQWQNSVLRRHRRLHGQDAWSHEQQETASACELPHETDAYVRPASPEELERMRSRARIGNLLARVASLPLEDRQLFFRSCDSLRRQSGMPGAH